MLIQRSLVFSFLLILFIQVEIINSQKSPIEHVVVLMLENRSFDHMVGYLKQTLNEEIEGLNGTEFNYEIPFNTSSRKVFVANDSPFIDINPGHSVQDATYQIYGTEDINSESVPLMNGFVGNAMKYYQEDGITVMKCFNSSMVPSTSLLAKEFALFDHWYSSVPGPTEVNRMYVHSATSHGMAYNDLEEELLGAPQKTIYESLSDNNLSWNIYYEEITTTLFFKNLRDPEYFFNFKQFVEFEYDVANGNLANYSFLEPRYFDFIDYAANDEHPSHDVSQGELLIKQVYDMLRNGPQWNSTLLIITYDEHGGFYDHVTPPTKNIPNPDGLDSTSPPFNFTRLGVRVPCIMISPWIDRGTVVKEPENGNNNHYEHSSIPATLNKHFDLGGFLTKRDEWAATFESIFSQRTTPRTDCPLVLPDPPLLSLLESKKSNDNDLLNDLQKGFVRFASLLTGDDQWKYVKTENEGSTYCRNQLAKFFSQKNN